jgi:hypothetical protein
MKRLSVLLISCYVIPLFAADSRPSAGVSRKAEGSREIAEQLSRIFPNFKGPELNLSPLSIDEFNASLNTAQEIIKKDGFSTETGLSGIFYRMWQDGAQKIASETVPQAYAVDLWRVVEKDPAYQVLVILLTTAPKSAKVKDVLDLGNTMVAQTRKDVALRLNQDGCNIEFPKGDLNKVLSITFGGKETIAELFKRNQGLPAQDTEIRAASIVQAYALQIIVEKFVERRRKEAFARLIMGTSESDNS